MLAMVLKMFPYISACMCSCSCLTLFPILQSMQITYAVCVHMLLCAWKGVTIMTATKVNLTKTHVPINVVRVVPTKIF